MPPSDTTVEITGIGLVTPLGHDLPALGRRYFAGERAAVAGGGAFVDSIPMEHVPQERRARIGRADRLCHFLLSASYAAVQSAGLDVGAAGAERCGISFGTGLGCLLTNEQYHRRIVEHGPGAASPRLFAYTVSSAAAGEVSIALGIQGPNLTVHMGAAAGLGAVGYGFDLIRMGKADVVLAGGGDVLGAALVDALRDMQLLKTPDEARPFTDSVAGVFPAEAAAVFVLERGDLARRRGARSLGRVLGYAAGFEPTLPARKRRASGLVATFRRALASASGAPELALCSAHGTPVDVLEREAISACGEETLLLAPKAALGEAFAGSGSVALALAAAGLAGPPPAVADALAFAGGGAAVGGERLRDRLRETRLVMVDSVCYSGNVVSLLLARETLE